MTELSTTVLRKSKGAKIKEGDAIVVWYEGELLNGERFDANYDFTTFNIPVATTSYIQLDNSFISQPTPSGPFQFVIGAGGVIEGWDQVFKKGRRIGEVLELTIPSELAYGEDGVGTNIPPNSDLVFTVEVLAALPKGSETAVFPQLKDLGVDAKKLGIKPKELTELNGVKVGLDGADRLIGDNTKDLLIGLGGNDKLLGGGGGDLLIGGKGSNRYVYTDSADSQAGDETQDSIYGFGKKDKINLRGLNDGVELSFIGGNKFSGTAGDLRFKKETLSLDLDGDKIADFAIALPDTNNLSASNLIL